MYIVTIDNNGVVDTIHGYKEKLYGGKVVKGINAIDSCTLSLLPSNIGFNRFADYTTLVRVFNTNKQRYEFQGRALYTSTEMNENGLITKEVTCESFLGYLCDSQQFYIVEKNWTVLDFLSHVVGEHNGQVEEYKHFQLGTIDNPEKTLYCGIQRENTWETIKKKLIEALGGEIRFRVENGVLYLDYVSELGTTSQTKIALSRNMKSIVREKDPTAFVTRVIPLGEKLNDEGEERLTIGEAAESGGKIYIDDTEAIEEYGIHVGYVEFDDVTDPNNLYSKGLAWLKENNKVQIKYSITAIDLSLLGKDYDDFDVYNRYPIENGLIGVNDVARVIKKNIDICEETKSTLEIGDNFKTLSELQKEQQTSIELATKKVGEISANYVTNKALENRLQYDSLFTTSVINQLSNEIKLSVSGEYVSQTDFETYKKNAEAKLELKIEKDDSDSIISIINAAANVITIESDNFKLSADGTLWAQNAEITGTITASALDIQAETSSGGNARIYTSNGQLFSVLRSSLGEAEHFHLFGNHANFYMRNADNTATTAEGDIYTFNDMFWIAAKVGTGYLSGTWSASACLGSASDRNLKHDIEGLNDKYTVLFDSLTPVRYKYNDGTSDRFHTGFIAQEVEESVISAGLTTKDFAAFMRIGDSCSLRYEEFIALCVDQIQKLKKRVKSLEEKECNNG